MGSRGFGKKGKGEMGDEEFGGNEDIGECLRVLDRISEVGLRRLRPDSVVMEGGSEEVMDDGEIREEDMKCLMGVILENADVFEALCRNIEQQVKGVGGDGDDDSGLAIMLRVEGLRRVEDVKVLELIQRSVQVAHLEAMKECLEKNDIDGAVSHIRFLHTQYGVDENDFRMVLQDLLKRVLFGNAGYGDTWLATRHKLLAIYGEALSSICTRLVQMIEIIQDELLSEEIEMHRASDSNQIPPPLDRLQNCVAVLRAELSGDVNSSLEIVTSSCMRDMYHYARVSGSHILECVMNVSLTAVKRKQLQEASSVLSLFPRLQPLVAIMGWDILHGDTALRRKLMQLLWTSKSQYLRLEEPSLYGSKSDEVSCVEHLCDFLCYQLDLASFVACVNSGQSWSSKSSLLLSGRGLTELGDQEALMDPFVENLILERLSVHSPLRVLFDVVPTIKFQDAIELFSMQPITSTVAAWKRMQDVELIHMRYALDSAVLSLGAMARCANDESKSHKLALRYVNDLKNHLDAVNSIPRKIMMVNIIISLLYMDNLSSKLNFSPSPDCPPDLCNVDGHEEGNELVVSFTRLLLDILRHNLPAAVVEQENEINGSMPADGKQALEWRISTAKRFIEDWEWRLSILQCLLPISGRQWRWEEALTVLRAAPSKLLNLCMQRAKYDIGEEAVNRFSLPPEDKATLDLAEWVDGAFKRASVEDAVSRVADGTIVVQELDFSSIRSQLSPLAAILLFIDVAATCSKSGNMSQKLLDQAQVMLSEIYPGPAPKMGSTYWDQIHEMAVISVTRRVLKRLHEFMEQDEPPVLQSILSGDLFDSSSKDSQQQGNKERALVMLHQMIEDAHKGKRQFLSGKLHNLARAIADEETGRDLMTGENSTLDKKDFSIDEKNGVLGLGLRAQKQSLSSVVSDKTKHSADHILKDAGKRIFGPLNAKSTTYLSQFILHIAAIGDIVDGTDTTHDFNYFSVIYEWPKDLLTRLVFDRGSTDAAAKVADIMSVDFVQEVLSACVPPVYPPRSGHGWAHIAVIPTYPKSCLDGKVISPSAKTEKPSSYSPSSATPGISLYPLQLDILKHLVKLSPVRAVLACVFGSSLLHSGGNVTHLSSSSDGLAQSSGSDQIFFEFALDQSERFPTLNRWIQMQSNLHRVSEVAVTAERSTDMDKCQENTGVKRYRDHDTDSDLELDDISGLTADNNQGNVSGPIQDSVKSETDELNKTVFLSFDWENEKPYENAVERLIDDGKLMDALALSDRCLRNGASDHLLQLLIEHEERSSVAVGSQGHSRFSVSSNSWQYCLRLKDKHLAARLALKYLNRWELDAAVDVLTMCSCHLSENIPVKNEVVQMRQALLRYNHILSVDKHYNNWQEVEAEFKEDPEGMALKLAEKGAVSAALEVAESASLSIELRRELQGRQLVKLLTADPINGGGPAEASRFLSSLRDSEDALPVVMGAMQLLPNLRSKQLLVHFFLKRRDGNLSEAEIFRLNSWALGLRVLASLPLPWQQRCSSLHEHPVLILEVLLMRKQLQSASQILKEFPSLRDDNRILTYASKAISVTISTPRREQRVVPRARQKKRVGTPARSSFSNSLSNFQKEARRAFSWAPRNTTENSPTVKDVHRKRKNSGIAEPERVAWEAMTGIQEDRVSLYSTDSHERFPSVSIAEEWMLTGDPIKDDAVRSSHRYESAPDIILFKALVSLCSDENASAKGALDICINHMKNVLSSEKLPENASMEIIGQAYHATETFVQGLLFAKTQLRKLSGVNNDFSSNSERGKDADDASSDAGSSSMGSQSTDELIEVLSQTDIWLKRAELLQSLLGSGIAVSLDDIADKESSAHLRDRLILEERYSMAVYTCKKCKIDAFPVWNAWGLALIRMEHYAQARVKFKQALQLYKGDAAPMIQDIINAIEGSPPADVPSVRSMYEHLAKSAPTILDDSLSADSYLNVLYMPSTFPRSERSRRSQEAASDNSLSSADADDGPRSNLDNIRYLECYNYLQEYSRQNLLGFMFKHGHYKDACLLLFPENNVPPPSQLSSLGGVTSSSAQRSDLLSTDYGTIDDLCDLCVGYGAMPVLEEVMSSRMLSTSEENILVNQHTVAALARICTYCETHKHFNFLYRFQVIRQDHVAAGLCCIQLFLNSSSLDESTRHLLNAKMHFDEGLSARYRISDSTKVVTKGIRGRSASEKLTEEGLVKFSARVAIQLDVVKSFNDTDGPQWRYSLFGNPNDPETFRRRCEIAETLAEKNFDLAFQVIYEFNLSAVDIYAAVAASLADRKRGGQLTEFFRNIKGTIDDEDWDQVVGAAVNVYANKHKERPDRLIDMLTSSHRKVLACVVCGRLKSAFQIASRSGSVADVQYVAHQALHANALPVLDMCKQWLAQYM